MKASFLIFVTMFLILGSTSYTQENLDVLPEEGRNNLFHDYLINKVNEISDFRQTTIEDALTDVSKLQALQKEHREDYLMLLGNLPEETPLNAEIVGTIEADGYKIEKVLYESRPNFHETANFYIPTTGTAPYPTVIVLCGHYPIAKAVDWYQDLCILLVNNGFAAFVVDPVCQAERYQIINPNTGRLAFEGQSGTAAHSRLDMGAVLCGTSIMAYSLWDNHRGVDYLCTRTDVVDTSRIGCTGHSGGGAQATYLLAFDQRLKVGVVANYLTNEDNLFSNPDAGPQTASQNLSYEGAYGIDQSDYVRMFAPKPYMIIGTTGDADQIFKLQYVQEVFDEAKQVYDALDASEKIALFGTSDMHDYTQIKREAAVKWFRTWLCDDTTTVVETQGTHQTTADLQVTETGQVMTSFEDEKSVVDLNVELANSYAPDREKFWTDNSKDSCLNKVKSMLMLEDYETPVAEVVETIDRDNLTIDKVKITSGNHVPVTGLMCVPKNISGKVPAVLYVDGRGKDTDAEAGGIIEYFYTDSGKVVFTIDVRGFGETADDPNKNESKHANKEHRNAVISAYVGKSLVGQRVEDIFKALEILVAQENVDAENISIVGIDRAASAVLHAAALEPRFKSVTIRKYTHLSWTEIVADVVEKDNMTHVVPNALQFYDYTDLVNAIAPRTVMYSEEPVVSVEKNKTGKVNQFDLLNNFPNPFNPKTEISYVLVAKSKISLHIYNSVGQKIATLLDSQEQPAGKHHISWNGTNDTGEKVASGVYFYSLETSDLTTTRKMLLMK